MDGGSDRNRRPGVGRDGEKRTAGCRQKLQVCAEREDGLRPKANPRLKLRKPSLDWLLIALSLGCVLLMLISSADPLLPALQGTFVRGFLDQFSTGNQIAFDLSVGTLAGVFVYYLVVRLPEYGKRRRVRAHLRTTYESFKRECIAVYLSCFMQSYPAALPDSLSAQEKFKEFFKEQHVPGQTKWDAVANGLNDERVKRLVVELEILMQEIQFVLQSVDVDNERAFGFFKRLSQVMYRSKNWTSDYDDVKSMLRFLWSLHTGWSWVEGYPDTDPVEDTIASI